MRAKEDSGDQDIIISKTCEDQLREIRVTAWVKLTKPNKRNFPQRGIESGRRSCSVVPCSASCSSGTAL